MTAFFVDSFSVGLDEIPRKEITHERVLSLLHQSGRFSVFEATAHQKIAQAMHAIMRSNLVERTDDGAGTYPWTYVRLTPAGLRAIGLDPADTTEETDDG